MLLEVPTERHITACNPIPHNEKTSKEAVNIVFDVAWIFSSMKSSKPIAGDMMDTLLTKAFKEEGFRRASILLSIGQFFQDTAVFQLHVVAVRGFSVFSPRR